MIAAEAIALIHSLIEAEVDLMNRQTKIAEKMEATAVRDLFVALIGRKPAAQELKQMVSI